MKGRPSSAGGERLRHSNGKEKEKKGISNILMTTSIDQESEQGHDSSNNAMTLTIE